MNSTLLEDGIFVQSENWIMTSSIRFGDDEILFGKAQHDSLFVATHASAFPALSGDSPHHLGW